MKKIRPPTKKDLVDHKKWLTRLREIAKYNGNKRETKRLQLEINILSGYIRKASHKKTR